MGNASARDKYRHSSGEDSGPTMAIHDGPSGSLDDDDYSNAYRSLGKDDIEPMTRPRASTLTSGEDITAKTLPTVFKWEGGGKSVCIAGSFDSWKGKIPMAKSHGDFYTIIELPEGTHQYKFLIDGQWRCDDNEKCVDNPFGTQNNQMIVRASDFEVFEALDSDILSSGQQQGISPPGDYTQIVPPRNSGIGFHHSGPPILPPHLLQVILNKEVPQHCEPTLLPEPNHVMLNHLYALSIKDSVMVLSATMRYRKKYVTTLLYKPI